MMEWLTGLLAVATVCLAWATWGMAKATKKLADIEAEPQLAVKDIALADGTDPSKPNEAFVNIELVFSNPGKLLVQYRMESLDASIEGCRIPSNSEIKNRGGAVHPGHTSKFIYPSIFIPMPVANPANGSLAINVLFWSRDGQRRSMRLTVDLVIHNVGKGTGIQWRWFNTSGPIFG